jgi:hypothetical protein
MILCQKGSPEEVLPQQHETNYMPNCLSNMDLIEGRFGIGTVGGTSASIARAGGSKYAYCAIGGENP